jgi:hypothetical protein
LPHQPAPNTIGNQIFLTQSPQIHCIHEPFGDAFYFGPERLSERYENDEVARMESGFADVTYGGVVKRIVEAQKEVSLKVISGVSPWSSIRAWVGSGASVAFRNPVTAARSSISSIDHISSFLKQGRNRGYEGREKEGGPARGHLLSPFSFPDPHTTRGLGGMPHA